MSVRLSNLREYLSGRLWFLPGVGVVGGIVAAGLTLPLEGWFLRAAPGVLVQGDLETSRSILSVVASSMLTFTALVFSITLVVLTQAATQYSPRVVRTFLHDRVSQLTLATFLGTFSYSLLVLRFSSAVEGSAVPHLGTWICFALVLFSLYVFVGYLNHIVQSIRVGHLTRSIAKETTALIGRVFPEPCGEGGEERVDHQPPGEPDARVAWPGSAGVLANYDLGRLTRIAGERGCQIVVQRRLGDFLTRDAPLLLVHGSWEEGDAARAAGCFLSQPERTMQQDPAFGLRQLVDIASRALSPGVNDPTTAVQAIDHLHELLRELAGRDLGNGVLRDDDGHPRVFLEPLRWEEAVDLSLDELRLFSKGSLQVSRRLRALLEDLLASTPAHRHGPLHSQLSQLERVVLRGFEDREDREAASQADEQGIGS